MNHKSPESDSTRVSPSVKKEVAAGQHRRSSRSGKGESSPLNSKRKQAAAAFSGIEVDDPFVLMGAVYEGMPPSRFLTGDPANEEAIWRSENEDKVTYFLSNSQSDGEESGASNVPEESPIKPRQAARSGESISALQMPVRALNLTASAEQQASSSGSRAPTSPSPFGRGSPPLTPEQGDNNPPANTIGPDKFKSPNGFPSSELSAPTQTPISKGKGIPRDAEDQEEGQQIKLPSDFPFTFEFKAMDSEHRNLQPAAPQVRPRAAAASTALSSARPPANFISASGQSAG
ncbi:hypothetical protein H1R20_g8518, partial [Candolleomyces eurysporus]